MAQAKLDPAGAVPTKAVDGAGVADGAGAPLPKTILHKMERAFATDFGEVRVHEGPEAQAIGARAFARGNALHFAPGAYDPNSQAGQELIGHELAHVVQQRAGRVQGTQASGGMMINGDAGFEAEADAAGARAARGEAAGLAGGGSASGEVVQRQLSAAPVDEKLCLYQYEQEEEERPPRGTKNTKQAASGIYQHFGNGYFRRHHNNQTLQEVYFYFAASSTLRMGNFGNGIGNKPVPWTAPNQKTGKDSDPIGRANADEQPIAWYPKDTKNPGMAAEIAKQLQIPLLENLDGYFPIPTLANSPLLLFTKAPLGEGQMWAGRDQQVTGSADERWQALVDARKSKDSEYVEPAKPATSRKGRPTAKYFGNISATQSWKNRPNPKGQVEYEWCHLIGDGDGGSNRPHNLVVGTRAANTEQLVFETVHRQYRGLCKKHGLRIVIRGRASLAPTDDSLHSNHGHVGDWLRYTIGLQQVESKNEVFVLDHIFDAHREKISKNTVRVMLVETHVAMRAALSQFNVVPDSKIKVKPTRKVAASEAMTTYEYKPGNKQEFATRFKQLQGNHLGLARELQKAGMPRDELIEVLNGAGVDADEIIDELDEDSDAAATPDDKLDDVRQEALSWYLEQVDVFAATKDGDPAALSAIGQQLWNLVGTLVGKKGLADYPPALSVRDEILEGYWDHVNTRFADRPVGENKPFVMNHGGGESKDVAMHQKDVAMSQKQKQAAPQARGFMHKMGGGNLNELGLKSTMQQSSGADAESDDDTASNDGAQHNIGTWGDDQDEASWHEDDNGDM